MARCECGEVKNPAALACDRCAELDEDGREGLVVSAMRTLGGPASRYEIAEESGLSVRSVRRALRELEGVGRIDSAEAEGADDEWQTVLLYWLVGDRR